MVNGTSIQNTLVPLVLRLVLGVIMIAHGWDKVGGDYNDWGTAWAVQLWLKQARAPQDPLAKLDGEERRLEEEQKRLEKELADGVSDAEQKRLKERRVKELKDKLVPQMHEFKEALKRVYGRESPTPPVGLNYAATQLAVAWGELVGGVALVLGLLTRLAALALIPIQVGAIATVTWGKGFSFTEGGGYEFNLALLAMCVALALAGGGLLSVDDCLRARRKRLAPAQSVPVA